MRRPTWLAAHETSQIGIHATATRSASSREVVVTQSLALKLPDEQLCPETSILGVDPRTVRFATLTLIATFPLFGLFRRSSFSNLKLASDTCRHW